MWLARAPRWLVLVGLIAVVVAALLAPGRVGAALLLVLAALVAWLLSLAWPALSVAGRGNRLLLIAVVVGYAVIKALH